MNEEILSRRAVLQGALVLGSGICLPILVSGCNSKNGSTPAATPIPASPSATGNDATAPATAKRVTQVSVQYQLQPKGDRKCSACVNFIAESNSCRLVEGPINPQGWCALWMQRS